MKIIESYAIWVNWDDLFSVTLALAADPETPAELWNACCERLKRGGETSVMQLHVRPFDIQRVRMAAQRAGITVTTAGPEEAESDVERD